MPRSVRPRRPRVVRWPEEATIAVSVSVAFESFERHSQYRQEFRDSGVDHFSLSFGEYGARAGVWRLLDLFAEQDVPVGFSVSGLAARQHPEVVAAIRAEGHELVGHGWANDIVMGQELDAERELVPIIWGHDDRTAPVNLAFDLLRAVHAHERDTTLSIVNKCGHFPYREHTAWFNDVLGAFVSRIDDAC